MELVLRKSGLYLRMPKRKLTEECEMKECLLCKDDVETKILPVQVILYHRKWLPRWRRKKVRHRLWFCNKACLMKWTGQYDSAVRETE